MDAIAERLSRDHPRTNSGWGAHVVRLHEEITGGSRQAFLALLGSVSFVLLIACANLANLFLARSTVRRREFVLRSAIGASRSRLVRQVITESLVIAGFGCGLALIAFEWFRAAVTALAPATVPRLADVGLDARGVGFAIGLSITAGITISAGSLSAVFGALRLGAADMRGIAGPAGNRMRRTLVAAEIGFAVVLLTGAALMGKSLLRLISVDPGFNPYGLVAVGLELPSGQYDTGSKRAQFFNQVVERIASIPGVQSAAAAFPLPMQGRVAFPFSIDGSPATQRRTGAYYRSVSASYFETLGVPIVRGRAFSDLDREGAVPVVIVNQTMATRYWPDGSAIGRRITITDRNDGDRATSREIVGIAGDVRHLGLDAPSGPEMYVPYLQAPSLWMDVVVRTDDADVMSVLSREVHAVDPAIPVERADRLDDIVAATQGPRRFVASLLGVFAALAVGLTMLGIWGVTAYTVTQRMREFGVRMALGASSRDVLLLLMRSNALVAVAGTAAGMAGAYALTTVLNTMVFGISVHDPVTFVVVALSFPAVAVMAGYLPARRATRVDPVVSLRAE